MRPKCTRTLTRNKRIILQHIVVVVVVTYKNISDLKFVSCVSLPRVCVCVCAMAMDHQIRQVVLLILSVFVLADEIHVNRPLGTLLSCTTRVMSPAFCNGLPHWENHSRRLTKSGPPSRLLFCPTNPRYPLSYPAATGGGLAPSVVGSSSYPSKTTTTATSWSPLDDVSTSTDVAPRYKRVFFFPGQGAQFVGMAKDTAASCPPAKALFEKASEILGYDLLKCCVHGPKDLLDKTDVCQPAIFVSSMAAVEKLRADKGEQEANSADSCLGLSLGEYSALCYAGALNFEDGVKVTQTRGKAMQAAADSMPGGMVSVIGLNSDVVEKICQRVREDTQEHLQLANFLCDGNYVVSGSLKACAAAENIAKLPNFKARMTMRLAVAGAFHTKFMQKAVDQLQEVLHSITIHKPRLPVISNVDATPHSDPAVIQDNLLKQVTSPVKWEQSVKLVLDRGMETGYELGPGSVLAGILKRIDRTKPIISRQ